MSASRPSDQTVAYYDEHAEEFARETFGVDMATLYAPFLALVPPGGHILDAGCGPGRDALAFKRLGYQVTAVDASAAMARLAERALGGPVVVARLQEVEFREAFDGVWACASLLHVPKAELAGVLGRFARALRPGGVLYASFKQGAGEEVRGGRLFCDYDEESLGEAMAGHPQLEVLKLWRTADLRPGRAGEPWVNALARWRP